MARLQEKLQELRRDRKALLATNFYNFETLSAILIAASRMQSPVILQLTQSSIQYMGLNMAVAMARCGMREYGITGWIHLDHANSVESIKRCLDAGFDSVMIDVSHKSFDENVSTTSQVVELAKAYGANVEAELGYIAKLGQAQDGGYTTAAEAQAFVKQTGVDALAVAIGSAHGFYKQAPKLDIARLREIASVVDTPLVLHGSSGIPDPMLSEAIRAGISKVNLATEIKDNFMRSLRESVASSTDIDIRNVFPKAMAPVIQLLQHKYEIMNA